MARVVVQKFGGTSVSTAAARERVVHHVRRAREAGNAVAIVVSALGRRGDPYATDTLLDLLRAEGLPVDRADYTMMFVTGEMIAAAVMSHCLKLAGIPAVALAGLQAGIVTDGDPTEADILHIETARLRGHLDRGEVPVTTGGQGVALESRDFNTLGRGASDTSGVAIGVALGAERVDIFTDVDGVASADPRAVPDAVFRDRIGFERMHVMARFGAKVVHPRAILAGWRGSTPIVVRSTFSDGPGTWIGPLEIEPAFTGIATLNAMPTVCVAESAVPSQVLEQWERRRLIMNLHDRHQRVLVLAGPDGGALSHVLSAQQVTVERRCEELAWVTVVGDTDVLRSRLEPDIDLLRAAGVRVSFCQAQENRLTFLVDPGRAREAAAILHASYAGLTVPR